MPNKIQREDTTSGAAYLCKELPHKRVRRKKTDWKKQLQSGKRQISLLLNRNLY